MRINLLTPYADKDQAKALGARWDAARKLWYIVDVADLTPFMRWIPDLVAATQAEAATTSKAAAPRQLTAPGVMTGPQQKAASCACAVLPWEDCPHTTARS